MQHSNTDSCILLKFYIKPQRTVTHKYKAKRCILLKFYIKPQLSELYITSVKVVSY